MKEKFYPQGRSTLIGSLPLGDHQEAAEMVLRYSPEIPAWIQLPVYAEEGMIFQFMPGLPGLTIQADRAYLHTAHENFPDELLHFYEEYMAVSQGEADMDTSRFVLKPDTARGFFVFLEYLQTIKPKPAAVKGQVTGPLTFATAVKDQGGRSIFYDEQVRDAAVKLLAMKAKWQVRQLSGFGYPVIVFLDEPALAGFGSSELISISKQDVKAALNEVIEAVHAQGGLAGIHVCANTEWDLIMDTEVDIVNFDSYSFFDRFVLYAGAIKKFLLDGKFIAWGIVPTGNADDIERETPESLASMWEEQMKQISALGFDRETILKQSLITPSCGTGSLRPEHAERVLHLTRELSAILRTGNR
ncbi:MAG: hypothetical protein R2941_08880 [Desulfobacterales bacterium]